MTDDVQRRLRDLEEAYSRFATLTELARLADELERLRRNVEEELLRTTTDLESRLGRIEQTLAALGKK